MGDGRGLRPLSSPLPTPTPHPTPTPSPLPGEALLPSWHFQVGALQEILFTLQKLRQSLEFHNWLHVCLSEQSDSQENPNIFLRNTVSINSLYDCVALRFMIYSYWQTIANNFTTANNIMRAPAPPLHLLRHKNKGKRRNSCVHHRIRNFPDISLKKKRRRRN